MSQTVKVAGLQAGMRVTAPILGKKGDVKVNKGEVLSKMHVDKLNKWTGVDAANPRGIEVENALRHSAQLMPDVVDHPEKSPLMQDKAKENMRSKMAVGVDIKDGKVVHNEEQIEDVKSIRSVARRGRPKKKRA